MGVRELGSSVEASVCVRENESFGEELTDREKSGRGGIRGYG